MAGRARKVKQESGSDSGWEKSKNKGTPNKLYFDEVLWGLIFV